MKEILLVRAELQINTAGACSIKVYNGELTRRKEAGRVEARQEDMVCRMKELVDLALSQQLKSI